MADQHRDVDRQEADPPDAVAADDEDNAAMNTYATALADAVEASLPAWVGRAVASRLNDPITPETESEIEAAGALAARTIGPKLRALLELDIEEQWTNPLAIIRTAVEYPTPILSRLGVEAADRDETDRRLHPDDTYDLTPAAFGDLGPSVHEAGLVWGAAKAHLHLQRRKRKEMT